MMSETTTKRFARVSTKQQEIIVEFLESNKQFADIKFGPTFSKNDYNALWVDLAKQLNECSRGGGKDVSHWKVSLCDWKSNTRKKVYNLIKSSIEDGPKTDKGLNPIEERLRAVYGWGVVEENGEICDVIIGEGTSNEQTSELVITQIESGNFDFEKIEPTASTSSTTVSEDEQRFVKNGSRKRNAKIDPLTLAPNNVKDLNGASAVRLAGIHSVLVEQSKAQNRQADATERIAIAEEAKAAALERIASAQEARAAAAKRANDVQAQFSAALVALTQAIARK